MSWRKIDVKGSDVQAIVWGDRPIQRIEWQPLNGSRYQIVLVEISPEIEIPGLPSDGGVLVVEGPTNKVVHSGYFNKEGFLTADYVQRKMSYQSLVDASEVTKIIGTLLMRPIRVWTRSENGELFRDNRSVDIE